MSSTQTCGLRPLATELGAPIHRGHGRTARATCYYLLCVREGRLLPGQKIVPERIRENRTPYVEALRAADRAWDEGHFNINEMESYLAQLLAEQLQEAITISGPRNPAASRPKPRRAGAESSEFSLITKRSTLI